MVVIGIDRKKRRGNGGEEQYVEHEQFNFAYDAGHQSRRRGQSSKGGQPLARSPQAPLHPQLRNLQRLLGGFVQYSRSLFFFKVSSSQFSYRIVSLQITSYSNFNQSWALKKRNRESTNQLKISNKVCFYVITYSNVIIQQLLLLLIDLVALQPRLFFLSFTLGTNELSNFDC